MRPADRKDRTDLTSLPLVTIDGETAKDFDDAVYCERDGQGLPADRRDRRRQRITCATATRSTRDARERGTSVYFPRRVIPMLPEALSNELCSLKPDGRSAVHGVRHGDRRGGEIDGYTFYPAVMHSRARLTYTQVWAWLIDPATRQTPSATALLPHLADLYALYKVLAARARASAARSTSTPSSCARVRRARQDRAHRARAAQRRAQADRGMHARGERLRRRLPAEHKHPALYRVHEGPPPEKLAALREFLASSALTLGGGDKPTRGGLREAARPDPRPARFRAAADGAAALAVAGALPPGQRRPLRPRLRRVRAFHLADPPLSRPARPSRDQGRARRQALYAEGLDVGGARRALLA